MNIWPNVPKSPEVITHMDWLILNEPEKPKIANMARLFRDHYTPPTEKELARKRELLKIQQQAKEWAKKKEGFRRSETLYSHPAFINREFDEFV
jgi:hypothetical protein